MVYLNLIQSRKENCSIDLTLKLTKPLQNVVTYAKRLRTESELLWMHYNESHNNCVSVNTAFLLFLLMSQIVLIFQFFNLFIFKQFKVPRLSHWFFKIEGQVSIKTILHW